MDHALQCQTGGYVIKRHNRIRDMLANFLDDVAHGVHTEPSLQPLSGKQLPEGSNLSDEARVDVAARGFWQECEMAFFDVKVFNPFAKSHLNPINHGLYKNLFTMGGGHMAPKPENGWKCSVRDKTW